MRVNYGMPQAMWLLLLMMMMLMVAPVSCSTGELKQYCLTETFHASCPDKHIIMMGEANYGRMRTGRCVKTDFGFVGCNVDVLYLMDRKCSGRQQCTITVPDSELEQTAPCNSEFKSYLEASYTCMAVTSATQRLCEVSTYLKVSTPSGYLSSLVTQKTACGSDSSPWVIGAQPGQHINFTLFDFNAPSSEGPVIKSSVCHMYAIIRESAKEEPEQIRICGRQSRERHVYTSMSGNVEVIIVNPQEEERGQFLIKYQVFGCQDPIIPHHMWITRKDHVATVGCAGSEPADGQWQMICQDNAWIGGFGNCSETIGAATGRHSGVIATILKLPVEVALVIIISVAFVVGIFIFVVGFFIIRSRRLKTTRRNPRQAILLRKSEAQPPIPPPTKYACSSQNPASNENKYSGSNDTLSVNENEYAYVWDTPQPPPGESQPQNETLDKRRNHSDPGIHQYQCATHARQPGTGIYEKRIVSPEERRYFEGECPPQYFELDPTDSTRGQRQHNVPT